MIMIKNTYFNFNYFNYMNKEIIKLQENCIFFLKGGGSFSEIFF